MKTYKLLITLLLAQMLNLNAASDPVRLSGHVPSTAVSAATFLKDMDADTIVPLTFVLPLRNKSDLEAFIQRIQDPNNADYGKHLTPEEFVEKFAPAQEDYDYLIAYAKEHNLNVHKTHSNRLLLNVSGPAHAIEAAFNVHMHHYQKPNGRMFYAPNNDPEVSSEIASLLHSIVGLDNHAEWRTYNRQKHTTEVSSHAHPSGPGGGYSPSDLLTAYNLTSVSANGANQAIALFELGTYQASDINTYCSHFKLPAPQLKNILVDGGASGRIDAEVTLDIELALALAPQSLIYVYEGPNSDQGVLDTYNQIAVDNLAKQVS